MDRRPKNGTIAPPLIAGMRVLVAGLGRFGGGVGAIRWLVSQGAQVTVTDLASRSQLADSLELISDIEVTTHLGAHDLADLDTADLVVVNPAVNKRTSDFFRAIVERKTPWTTEMNLFCERCPARVIAVTGTFGKSTTCAMLAQALEACLRAGGVDFTGVHLGGNIGRSLLTELADIRSTDVVVLEMSNAQLEDIPRISWAPEIAVICNLSEHHLDRYDSYHHYLSAKLNVVGSPSGTPLVIVGDIDTQAEELLSHKIRKSETTVQLVQAPNPNLELRVPGGHNHENGACVLTVCRSLGLDETTVRESLQSFTGLAHRLEYVRTIDGVAYYNDSKATSPTAVISAVESFDSPIVAIVGGQDKDVQLTDWSQVMAQRCRLVICIGQSGPIFAQALRLSTQSQADRSIREADSLEQALQHARQEARPDDVVLFSPGAPSFDSYANFAQRGQHFVDLVKTL